MRRIVTDRCQVTWIGSVPQLWILLYLAVCCQCKGFHTEYLLYYWLWICNARRGAGCHSWSCCSYYTVKLWLYPPKKFSVQPGESANLTNSCENRETHTNFIVRMEKDIPIFLPREKHAWGKLLKHEIKKMLTISEVLLFQKNCYGYTHLFN